MSHALVYILERPATCAVQHLALIVSALLRVVHQVPVSACPNQCLRSITSEYQRNGSSVDRCQMRGNVLECEGRRKTKETITKKKEQNQTCDKCPKKTKQTRLYPKAPNSDLPHTNRYVLPRTNKLHLSNECDTSPSPYSAGKPHTPRVCPLSKVVVTHKTYPVNRDKPVFSPCDNPVLHLQYMWKENRN